MPRALAAAGGAAEVRRDARVRGRAPAPAPRREAGSRPRREENGSFGVATIRREHVSRNDGELVFDFPAKSGRRRVQSVRDAAVLRAIEAMRHRRSGPERSIRAAIERVAETLGNTPAVCRDSYVDPRVFDRFREGVTVDLPSAANGGIGPRARARVERSVLELIT